MKEYIIRPGLSPTDAAWKEIEEAAQTDPIAHHFVQQFRYGFLSREQAAIELARALLEEKTILMDTLKMRQTPPPIILNVTQERADEIMLDNKNAS
jgi:hypothetical protein